MYTYEVPGYFSKSRAEVIKQKLQGRTYYNFNVQYGGMADNNKIFVSSEYDVKGKKKEFEEMVIFFVFNELWIDR